MTASLTILTHESPLLRRQGQWHVAQGDVTEVTGRSEGTEARRQTGGETMGVEEIE
jgi:hypothetical protein